MAPKRPPPHSIRLGTLNLHDPYVRVDVSDDEFLQVLERIEAQVETDGYVLDIVTGVDESLSPSVEELRIRRKPDGPPMSELVRIPLDKFLREIVDRAAFRWTRVEGSDRWTLDMIEHLESGGVEGAGALAVRRGRKPETARIRQEVDQVAELWHEALTRSAALNHIATRLGMSRRTAQRRVEAARREHPDRMGGG